MEHMDTNAVPRDMGDMILGVFLDREKARECALGLGSYYLGDPVPELFFVGERVENDRGDAYFQIVEREVEG